MSEERCRPVVDPLLRRIIRSECDVKLSNRAVIRHVISRLAQGWGTYRSLPRENRRKLMHQCIEQHRFNRREYTATMSSARNLLCESNTKK